MEILIPIIVSVITSILVWYFTERRERREEKRGTILGILMLLSELSGRKEAGDNNIEKEIRELKLDIYRYLPALDKKELTIILDSLIYEKYDKMIKILIK